jgi:hypothetical protein
MQPVHFKILIVSVSTTRCLILGYLLMLSQRLKFIPSMSHMQTQRLTEQGRDGKQQLSRPARTRNPVTQRKSS